jgi:hypothetical protein
MSFTIATGDSLGKRFDGGHGLETSPPTRPAGITRRRLAKAEGRKKFESLKVMYFDESVLTRKPTLKKRLLQGSSGHAGRTGTCRSITM